MQPYFDLTRKMEDDLKKMGKNGRQP
jgi:hypothetical protein